MTGGVGDPNYTALAQAVFNNTFGNNPERSYLASGYSNQTSPAIRMPDGSASAYRAGILDANGNISPAMHNTLVRLQINEASNALAAADANGMFVATSQSDINNGLTNLPSMRNAITEVAQSGFQTAAFPGGTGGRPLHNTLTTQTTQNGITISWVEAWRPDAQGNCVPSYIPYMVGGGNTPPGPLMAPAQAPAGNPNNNPTTITTNYNGNQTTPTPRGGNTTTMRR